MALSSPVLSRPSLPTRVLKDHFTTASSVLSLPYPLALHLIESALEKEPAGFDSDGFLAAFKSATGQLDDLRALHKTAALAFMAAGASVSSDPAVAGEGAPRLDQISTNPFVPPPNIRSVGIVRQRVITSLGDRAWSSLEESQLIDSIEGLALLNYIAERFDHPSGPEAKMRRVEAGARRASDWLDHDDSTIPEQSDAYTLGTSLITVAGEESCAHGASPDIPPYVFGQFVTAKTLGPLPTPSHDLSAAFTSDVSTFLKLFNSLVVPLHTQALNIERLHARDLVEPNEDAVELLWEKIDEAIEYAEETTGRILSDARIERDAAGLVENSWTRALLKNLLVQHALFSSFIFTIHKNLLKSGATVAPLVSRSEARVVARLAGLSKDIETLQTLTKTLEDIHHALGSYSKALDRLGPSLTPALLKLPSSDIENFQRVLDFAGYSDARASRRAEELEVAVTSAKL